MERGRAFSIRETNDSHLLLRDDGESESERLHMANIKVRTCCVQSFELLHFHLKNYVNVTHRYFLKERRVEKIFNEFFFQDFS